MNRLLVSVVVGVFVSTTVAAIALVAQSRGVAAPVAGPAPRQPGQEVGRFQIVNGAPTLVRTIMLLDTVTGNSWVTCGGDDVGDQWCKIPQTDFGTAPRK